MNLINPAIKSVTAFAPATCANVAVGFDILGFAIEQPGDEVTLTRTHDNQITIEMIDGAENLPYDSNKNTASVVVQQMCRDLNLDIGFSMRIQKGIPLCSGMGGSAASAVAALVACNAFLTQPLEKHQLVQYALLGEAVASGQAHADNVVPCLFGGFTLTRSINPIKMVALPIPDLYCVLVHPQLQVATKDARAALKSELSLTNYVQQSANLATAIAALYTGDQYLLQQSMIDIVIEPQRAQFVPGFYQIKEAALQAGALCASFSGSGPTLFAFTKSKQEADAVGRAMQASLALNNLQAQYWLSPISPMGANVTSQR